MKPSTTVTRRRLMAGAILVSCAPAFAWSNGVKVLLFTPADEGRNPSIANAVDSVQTFGAQRGWDVQATDDPNQFTNENLRQFDVVVWLNASGNMLSKRQQAAYEKFHQSGKGTVAVHSGGVGNEARWEWYRKMALGRVVTPPINREVTIINVRPQHPAAFLWPFLSRQKGEWYRLTFDPSIDFSALQKTGEISQFLMAYDPLFIDPGPIIPVSWSRKYDAGRYFYTMLGGLPEDYASQSFLDHLAGGIEWAAGRAPDVLTRATGGRALIFQEFNGVSPNGVWQKQAPSPDFRFEVSSNQLEMRDSSDISLANRHLVRRGIEIDPKRPYAIAGTFRFPGLLEPGKPRSFCVNLNVGGDDEDPRGVTTWAVNIHVLTSGTSVSKFMGFLDGGFFQVGQVENQWGAMDTDYDFEIHVNADAEGRPRRKMVSLRVKQDGQILESFETDYSNFPYQPDESKPVRFGLNGHGPSWVLRNLNVHYLDVAAPT